MNPASTADLPVAEEEEEASLNQAVRNVDTSPSRGRRTPFAE